MSKRKTPHHMRYQAAAAEPRKVREDREAAEREERERRAAQINRNTPTPRSMEPGSDLLPVFWILFFLAAGLLSWIFGAGL